MEINDSKLDLLPIENHVRLRGLATTRLDTFIDAVFAFATTMLVISVGSIPTSYDELMLAIKGIPAFIASFAQVMLFWLGHRRWSRYYGLETPGTILISLGLIFVILVYVYPLKLIFSALFAWVSSGYFPSEFQITKSFEIIGIFVIYGIGTFFLSSIVAILFLKAKKLSTTLRMNKIELLVTQHEIRSFVVLALTGIASAIFAIAMPDRIAIFAGFAYATLPITMPFTAIITQRKIKKLQSEL